MGDLSQMHSSAGMVGYLESAIHRNAAGSCRKRVSCLLSSPILAKAPRHARGKSEFGNPKSEIPKKTFADVV